MTIRLAPMGSARASTLPSGYSVKEYYQARAFETTACRLLNDLNFLNRMWVINCDRFGVDIHDQYRVINVEVKQDNLAARTGNVYVERWETANLLPERYVPPVGNVSVLFEPGTHFSVWQLGQEVMVISQTSLMYLTKRWKHKAVINKKQGYHPTSKGVVIPVDFFREQASLVTMLYR